MKNLPKIMLAALLLMASAHADEAASIKFDMSGMKIGDKVTADFAYNHCPAKDKGKPDITCSKSIEIDGGNVFVMYIFRDFKLITVALSYDSAMFNSMVAAYTAKFKQPPGTTESQPVTTRQGVEYTNETASWDTDSGVFSLAKYGSKITKGRGTLMSPEYMGYLKKKKAERDAELSNKL